MRRSLFVAVTWADHLGLFTCYLHLQALDNSRTAALFLSLGEMMDQISVALLPLLRADFDQTSR